jgi:hypothetical protein
MLKLIAMIPIVVMILHAFSRVKLDTVQMERIMMGMVKLTAMILIVH